jgi:hypothetical protein
MMRPDRRIYAHRLEIGGRDGTTQISRLCAGWDSQERYEGSCLLVRARGGSRFATPHCRRMSCSGLGRLRLGDGVEFGGKLRGVGRADLLEELQRLP